MRYWICICALMAIVLETFGQEDTLYLKRRDWVTGNREQLPEWVISHQTEHRTIGISDPGLRPEMARGQALLRSWMLHLLQQGIEVAMVKDYYVENQARYDHQQLQDKLLLLASLKAPAKEMTIRIGREWTSQYGECFLETFVVDKTTEFNDTLCYFPAGAGAGVMGELMLVNNSQLREQQEIRVEWMAVFPQAKIVTATDFLLRGNNEYRRLSRSINGWKFLTKDRGRFWYQNSGEKSEEGNTFCSLSDAYWCAQTESMLYALMIHSFPEVTLGNLGENYGEESKDLQREVVRGKITISIRHVCLLDNELYVDWDIQNQ